MVFKKREGYLLMKKKNLTSHEWVRRYFVLDLYNLSWYDSAEARYRPKPKALGRMEMGGRCEASHKASQRVPHKLVIAAQCGAKLKERTIQLACDTQDELDEWQRALQGEKFQPGTPEIARRPNALPLQSAEDTERLSDVGSEMAASDLEDEAGPESARMVHSRESVERAFNSEDEEPPPPPPPEPPRELPSVPPPPAALKVAIQEPAAAEPTPEPAQAHKAGKQSPPPHAEDGHFSQQRIAAEGDERNQSCRQDEPEQLLAVATAPLENPEAPTPTATDEQSRGRQERRRKHKGRSKSPQRTDRAKHKDRSKSPQRTDRTTRTMGSKSPVRRESASAVPLQAPCVYGAGMPWGAENGWSMESMKRRHAKARDVDQPHPFCGIFGLQF